ncbi:sigma-70 family RNA polymerase sigma factor [Lysinibacillus sp. NPDC093688]|uniref:sigma-70 family RNA polymerase sigma factor n=1 Tax=Lysinibacillus sp. NPDC093688 TaxID=3390577 RepID=UPI003D01CD27
MQAQSRFRTQLCRGIIDIYEKMEQFREEASVKTYLYRIAINKCHSYLSSWRYKKIQFIDYWSKLKSLSDNPEEEVLLGETDALLVASIEKLPTKYKDVLLLFHFAEFPLKNIAELLKLPENTIKASASNGWLHAIGGGIRIWIRFVMPSITCIRKVNSLTKAM